MAQGTLIKMARQLTNYCPSVPTLLAQQWIIDRYRTITENYLWSFKIGEGTFYTPAAYDDGTITMTNGSATVTGSGTTFTSGMIGRQLMVSGFVFTITAFSSATSITVDKNWYGNTASSLAYTILQAYITPSDSDFHSFISVIDPANGWRLRLWYNSTELDIIDARRSSVGTPILLASRAYNSSNVPKYELWPFSNDVKQFNYLYEKRITDLSAPTDAPPNIIRSDVLVKGALADLSRWPGSRENPNPMYDPYGSQYKNRESEFQQEVEKLLVSDQNIYMSDLSYHTSLPYAPLDSKFIQNHAF